MSAFSETEIDFLTTQRLLGRLATVGPSGQPHVVPVGWSYNPDLDTIDIHGSDVERTKKFRDVAANALVAFVVDDVLPPWRPRCIEIRGRPSRSPRPMVRRSSGSLRRKW